MLKVDRVNSTSGHVYLRGEEQTSEKMIERMTEELLLAYKRRKGNLHPPINPWILAELVDAVIEAAPAGMKAEGQLLPVRGGFIIRVRAGQIPQRMNLTICHEIAHTFFYNHSVPAPKRPFGLQSTSEEEKLCFTAARQLLLPKDTLKEQVHLAQNLPPLKIIKRIANLFRVSLPVAAIRTTLDTSLIDRTMFTFWEFNKDYKRDNTCKKDRYHTHPCSNWKRSYLSPKLTRQLAHYWRTKIFTTVYDPVREVLSTKSPQQIVLEIGKKRVIRLRVDIELWGSERVVTATSLLDPSHQL